MNINNKKTWESKWPEMVWPFDHCNILDIFTISWNAVNKEKITPGQV